MHEMNDTTDGETYGVWGGYSYSWGDERFPTLEDACDAYVARYESNGRTINGVAYPTWGDCQDDDYVLMTEWDGWTRAEVFAIARRDYVDLYHEIH